MAEHRYSTLLELLKSQGWATDTIAMIDQYCMNNKLVNDDFIPGKDFYQALQSFKPKPSSTNAHAKKTKNK